MKGQIICLFVNFLDLTVTCEKVNLACQKNTIKISVGNRTGKSQSIIGRAKPIDYRLYNRISVSYVKQHTIGPLKTTKNLNMYPVGLRQTARHVRS